MKNLFPILLILLSSCYTEKRARIHVNKAHSVHPVVVAEACASLYPVKDSIVIKKEYIQGKSDTLLQFVEVNCDSVIHDTIPGNDRIIRMPCPPSIKRVDTFIDHQYHTVENTAKVSELQLKLEVYRTDLEKLSDKVKDKNSLIRKLILITSAMGLGFLILAFIKFKTKLF